MVEPAGRDHTGRMDECCGRPGYDQTFTSRFARRRAVRYNRGGLDATERRLVDFIVDRGIAGSSVLEIGGGVGELQVELLRRGAGTAEILEISRSYEEQARALLVEAGVADRATRRIHDIALDPDAVDPADVVLLHRVVCCYPDHERLLAAAGSHARRLLALSFPPRTVLARMMMTIDNVSHRARRNPFRMFVHDPAALVATVEAQGLVQAYWHHGLTWDVVGFVRP